jgi:ISXO2 transposase-like protein
MTLLEGTIEADEAYVGGQAKWKHKSKNQVRRHHRDPGPRGGDKTPVFEMAQRGENGRHGKVVALIVDRASVWVIRACLSLSALAR